MPLGWTLKNESIDGDELLDSRISIDELELNLNDDYETEASVVVYVVK